MQVSSIAQAGLLQAIGRFDASAQRVARAGEAAGDVELATEAVEQVNASRLVQANLATLRTADEMQKRLLDMKV